MELSELLRTFAITGIELHACCLVLILLMYINMLTSFHRNSRKVDVYLTFVYAESALMIISDCLWSSLSNLGHPNNFTAYLINIIYFLASSGAAASWFGFCTRHLETVFAKHKFLFTSALLPYLAVTVLYLIAPKFGLIFSIQNGEYIRGNLFFLDPIIKMGYLIVASLIAFVCGSRRIFGYLRKKDFHYGFFSLPVLICGLLQTFTGVDFNCIGVTFGLILIYVTGITNTDSENSDALYSLGNSFEASYIVNMDTGVIRPLHQDMMHENDMPGMNSMDYTTHFVGILSSIVLPEDKTNTLETYKLENIAKRFIIDKSFNIRYRTKESNGQTAMHTASFIRATGAEGKQEFLLGINTIRSDSLLYERNESLNHENQRLEQINTSIIESVAKIVETRDTGSGEHIVRVKRLTEIFASEFMAEYPDENLNEQQVKLIGSASVLHDIGKIAIPDAVLLKPGRLTPEEFEIMKTHTIKGCDALNQLPLGLDDAFLECALSICRWHHEKYDGKGYPDGLKGEEIPLAAQFVSVADCFDALTSERPYKKAFSPEQAYDMIMNGECGMFSPKIIHVMEKQKRKLLELARLHN